MKKHILDIIKSSKKDFISGQSISNKLSVSRTSIWKYIKALKKDGYEIESVPKKGYRLISSPDLISYEEIKSFLSTKKLGKNFKHFSSIDSTNIQAKILAQSGVENCVIVSEEQTLGRGRLGRSWSSPKGKGIWLSLLLSPEIEPIEVTKLTQITAASICLSLQSMNINCLIKWPNDIVINNKKVCGILTEMSCQLNKTDYVIIGIGINVNMNIEDIPENLLSTATSLSIETGKLIDRKKLLAYILNNFEKLYNNFLIKKDISYVISLCKKNSILLGKEVKIITKNSTSIAKAIDIDSEGRLVVLYENSKKESIVSGEVSIRGLYGYV